MRDDNKEVYFVDTISKIAGHNLFVNTKFTKIKATVRISLRRPNFNYPFYLVGRLFL